MKILIADDESLVRQSIQLFLYDLGIDPDDIMEASNGLLMLEAIRSNHFDLALVDIRMPSINGLDAIRQARDLSPYTDFYILSGFDDFKYAQEGIRLGIRDYILKPLQRTQMEQILENTISRLEQQKSAMIHDLTLSIAALFSFTDENIRLPISCHPLLITNDCPDRPLFSSELLAKDNDKIIVIPFKQTYTTFLFLFELPEHPGYAKTYIEELTDRYHSEHTIIEGKIFTENRLWKKEYERMTALASFRFLFGGHKLYRNTLKVPQLPEYLVSLCHQCSRGLSSYAAGNYAEFSLSCEALLQQLPKVTEHYPSFSGHLLDFLCQAYHLEHCTMQTLKKHFLLLASTMNQTASKDFRYEEILQYIRNHYREDLTLSGVSAVFGLSPNYFSSLFKKRNGRNFVQFLTDLRIQEGKRLLLETTMTVHQISIASGYSSASFFIRAFKKAVGITPLEYRKNHENESISNA